VQSNGDGDEGGDVSSERTRDAHVHEGAAIWDAATDENDGAGGSGEGRSRE